MMQRLQQWRHGPQVRKFLHSLQVAACIKGGLLPICDEGC
jgi:hypothetical protein